MAMDAGAHQAPAGVIALVATAIAVPAVAGLLSGNLRIHAGAAILSTVLLIAARLGSGVELVELQEGGRRSVAVDPDRGHARRQVGGVGGHPDRVPNGLALAGARLRSGGGDYPVRV